MTTAILESLEMGDEAEVRLVEQLRQAARSAQPIAPLTNAVPDLDERRAYALQQHLVRLQAADEATDLAGLKLGLTSEAKQITMGVREPIYGLLLESRRRPAGAAMSLDGLIHPRIEPEIAVTLRSPLRGPGITPEAVAAALDKAFPALEVIDSRYANFKFTLPDVVADNTSAALWAIGEGTAIPPSDLRGLRATLEKNGEVVHQATGAAVLGDPLVALAWLANKLAEHDREIPAGRIILTGALTDAVPFTPGDEVRVTLDVLGTLTVRASGG